MRRSLKVKGLAPLACKTDSGTLEAANLPPKCGRLENAMSEQARSGGDEGTAPADLPYVDGRDMSPAQLRAEVAKESDPQIQHIEEVRDELVGVVDELGRRVDPRSWVRRISPAVGPGRCRGSARTDAAAAEALASP